MIRTAALALSALAVMAAPALAQEVRVQVAGRAAADVRADIVKAASTVCWKDVRGESLAVYLYPACVRSSVNDAVAQLGNAEVAAYHAANPAQPLELAAR